MNTEPPTGDDLTRMLVSMKKNVLERATDTTRRRPGRRFGIAFGLVALIGLGSAGGAVAMGFVPSPFEGLAQPEPTAVVSTPPAPTPTATPTPEPSAAPSTQPVGGTPEPYLPIDCATLATESSLTSLLRAPELTIGQNTVTSPEVAIDRQSGIEACDWTSLSDTAYASLNITSTLGGPSAADAVAAERAAGAVDLGVGDESTQTCEEGFGCRGTFVVGDFWFEYLYQQSTPIGDDTKALLTAHLNRVADVVEPLEPRLPWAATDEAARWARTGDCSTIALATPLSTLFSDPTIDDGPSATDYGSDTPLQASARDSYYSCAWSIPEEPPAGETPSFSRPLTVSIAGGARWGFEAHKEYTASALAPGEGADVTPVTVAGAEEAVVTCFEQSITCNLDVLVDDSWIRVYYNGQRTSGDKPVLIAVAESIIAAR
jgi:hypothetical protein